VTEYNPFDPRTHVDAFVTDYARTGNPLAAWYAYEAARRVGQPVPDLVLQYLDRVAARFRALGMGPILAIEHDRQLRQHSNPAVRARRARLPQVPHDPAPAIAKALEMHRKGRNSVFARVRAEAVAEHLAWEVAELVVTEDQKPDQALTAAAQDFGVSRETVRRAWMRHGQRALADIRHVKARAAHFRLK
jgi:hypothetical protein